jgi:hybrid polyketide synthase/nonribosomal peptide synthetase ACE1
VNIAALKILKGVALQELINQAVDTAPRELTPQLLSNDQAIAMSNEDIKESSPSSDVGSVDTPPSSASSVNTDPEVMAKPSQESDAQHSMVKSGQLSFSQSMFMFVHELLADKTTLNNSVLLHLQGQIQVAELARAIRVVGERHEALRTCIFSRQGELAQGVLEKSILTLEHKKIKDKQELFDEYEAIKRFVFDLGQGSSMRIVLLSYSPGDHYLVICLHHAMYDRASVDVLMGDIEQAYNGVKFNSSPLQHLEHSIKQREQYSDGEWKQAIEFWRQKLATIPEVLPLTRSRALKRSPLERYASTVQTRFSINSELASQIRNVARNYRCTPFHFYLAAFKVLLHRFLGTADVCIAIADNGRSDDAAGGALGPFLNTLPVRMNANGRQTFSAAVAEARQESLSALENTIPWELILNELQIPRHSTHVPLAQCFLNYSEDNIEGGKSFIGCPTDLIDLDQSGLAYDMTFTVVNSGVGGTGITLNIQESLYNEDDAIIIANGYEDILTEFAFAPEKHIGTKWSFRQHAIQTALDAGRGKDRTRESLI